jgi:hypothetical protein
MRGKDTGFIALHSHLSHHAEGKKKSLPENKATWRWKQRKERG